MLQALKPKGILFAVFVTALLFGTVHFGRLLFGSPLSLVLFQVLFAAFDGVLYAALRLRTNTLWTPILIHAAADLTLALGRVPQPLWRYLYLGSELLFLAYGLFLLRPYWRSKPRRKLAGEA